MNGEKACPIIMSAYLGKNIREYPAPEVACTKEKCELWVLSRTKVFGISATFTGAPITIPGHCGLVYTTPTMI